MVAVRNADLVDFFGEKNVVLLDPSALTDLGFPQEPIEVLTRVGLPVEVEPLPFHPIEPCVLADSPLGRAYCFGAGYGSSYCLIGSTEEVWELHGLPERPPTFINSSPSSFVECLLRFEILWRQIPEEFTTDTEVGAAWGDFLEAELRKVDPACVANPDNYFSCIVRDIKNGTF